MKRRKIDWDRNKERLNIRKHGIDFKTAAEVFGDPFQVTVQDRFENGEYRWQTVGFTKQGYLLLLVAHTLEFIDDEGNEYEYIRIVSARKADGAARKRYEKGDYRL